MSEDQHRMMTDPVYRLKIELQRQVLGMHVREALDMLREEDFQVHEPNDRRLLDFLWQKGYRPTLTMIEAEHEKHAEENARNHALLKAMAENQVQLPPYPDPFWDDMFKQQQRMD